MYLETRRGRNNESVNESITKNEYLLFLFHVGQVKQIHGNNSIINTK